MIVTEKVIINDKAYNRTFSDNAVHPIIRCGKDRYYEAVDPAGIQRTYFEENPGEESHEEDTDNG